MRNDRLSRAASVALACLTLGALTGAASAAEPTPQYHQVLRTLPQPVRAAERPTAGEVFVATKLTSRTGPAVRVDRFALLGVTAVPIAELQARVDASAGASLTPAQIDAIAEDVAKLYRAKGYPLAMVALVDVQGGTARLQVYEGKVANVRVEGAKGYTEEAITAPFLDLPRNKPLTAAELQHAARTLDDYPGLDVKVQALPAKTAGETDLVVKVTEQRLSGGVGVDNDGMDSIGRKRYRGELQWNSPSGWGDQLALSLMNTEMGGLQYARLDYSLPFNSEGTRAEFSYARAWFESDDLVDPLLGPYIADGQTSEIRVGGVSVLERSPGMTRVVEYYAQRLEGKNEISGIPVVLAPPFDASELTVFGIGWYRAVQQADGGHSSLRIGFESNAQHNDGVDPTALLGQLRLELENLSGDNVRIFTRLRGVMTASSAPLFKRFHVGGPDSVRAYDHSIGEGDGGFDATAEFRFGGVGDSGLRSEFVVFGDLGYVDSHADTQNVSPTKTSVGGVGMGLRYSAPGFLFALEYAYPVGQHATPDGDDGGYLWGRLSVGLD